MRLIPVRITKDASSSSGLNYDPPRFHVSKVHGDEVVWSCDSSGFAVDFGTKSPFQDAKFARQTPGSIHSGRVRDNVPAGDGTLYPYTVTMAGGASADPDGQVDN